MAEHIYKVIEIIGTSATSWEDAARRAVEEASKSLKDLRIAAVTAQDLKIEDGKVVAYRTKLSVSFRFHEELTHHE
jgi:flavin-binding protein dodecin